MSLTLYYMMGITASAYSTQPETWTCDGEQLQGHQESLLGLGPATLGICSFQTCLVFFRCVLSESEVGKYRVCKNVTCHGIGWASEPFPLVYVCVRARACVLVCVCVCVFVHCICACIVL